MKFAYFRSIRAVLTLAALGVWSAAAAETGTISAGTVNVRGRAGFIGEIVTRLKQGDPVTILDTVTLSNPKTGEPANWLKIALPANTPVWVHTAYVDPATQTINTRRLNVRGGPGINYSVLGTLDQGTAVKEIRRQGEWMEIEPTAELFAFVAAEMVARTAATPPATAVAETPATETTPPVTTPEPVTETPAPVTTELATEAPAQTQQPVAANETTPAPVTSTPPGASTAIVAEPAPAIATPPVEAGRELTALERAQQVLEQRTKDSQRWEIESGPDDQLLKELPPNRRVVWREGKVQRSISIQAPSPFILTHAESGLRLNYLYTSSTNVPLRELVGVKVRIKGEEGIDDRWPGTPVLLIKSLEVLP